MTDSLTKVVFYEAFEEEKKALEALLPDSIDAEYFTLTLQEAGHAEPPAPVISIRTQSVVPDAWLPKLSCIVSRSTGYDHLIQAAERGTVACGHLPEYCTPAVAEQAIMLSLCLMRKLSQQVVQFESFDRDGITGVECAGGTIAVFGVGRIGKRVAELGAALGMNVLGVDIDRKHADITYVEPDEAIAAADLMISAMSLNESSRNYFTYERLKKAKKTPVFVNVGRGESSPCIELLKAYDNGFLRGVALDVFDDEKVLAVDLRAKAEPSTDEHRALQQLRARPHVIMTPHNAFNTQESVGRKARDTIAQILAFIERGRLKWVVPVESATRGET